MVNPLKGDAASVATGKSLYSTHCKSCIIVQKGKGHSTKQLNWIPKVVILQ